MSGLKMLLLALVVASGIAACGEKQEASAVPELALSCQECHSATAGAIPGWPPLGTMSSDDLTAKLRGYRDSQIPESVMSDVSHKLSDADIQLLADYYGK